MAFVVCLLFIHNGVTVYARSLTAPSLYGPTWRQWVCLDTQSTLFRFLPPLSHVQVKQTVRWLQAMKDQGIEPNGKSYNSVIKACAHGGQVEEAVKWLQAMQDQGIKPDVKSYNSVITACAKGGQVTQAVQWLQAMQDQGIAPSNKSYTSVINACAQGGQVEEAVKWLQAMQDQGYAALSGACCLHVLPAATRMRAFCMLHLSVLMWPSLPVRTMMNIPHSQFPPEHTQKGRVIRSASRMHCGLQFPCHDGTYESSLDV